MISLFQVTMKKKNLWSAKEQSIQKDETLGNFCFLSARGAEQNNQYVLHAIERRLRLRQKVNRCYKQHFALQWLVF